MIELTRSIPAQSGKPQGRRLAATWDRDAALGFAVPLVIAPGPGFTSNPIVASGINSYMLLADIAVGVAGTLVAVVGAVRPDGTSWPSPLGNGNAGTAVAGFVLIQIGCRGRDQNAQSQGFSSFLVTITLLKSGAANVTLNSIRLLSMTRP